MRRTPRVILFLDATRGFDRGILSGIARYTTLNGPWVFFRRPPSYLKYSSDLDVSELSRWKPDGVICSSVGAEELHMLDVPIVAFEADSYSKNTPTVATDHKQCGRLAAQHLLGLAHNHVAFCGFNFLAWSNTRCEAFCEEALKFVPEVNVFSGSNYNSYNEYSELDAWLTSLSKPVGVFCVNDDRAATVAERCRILGLNVPEEISIIGVDDDKYICELENPQLSSIRVASEHGGYRAAELLHNIILGRSEMEGQQIVIPTLGISARKSTDVLMTQNEEVRKALSFIRENINSSIQVRDVVSATNLSHRTLNNQFQLELGHSIIKQLSRARVDYISRLLTETEMQIQEIASFVGYRDDKHFSRYFKRSTGLTPLEYRRAKLVP